MDDQGNWVTRKDRVEDPSITIPSSQSYAYVPDPTWYTCTGCQHDFSQEEIERHIDALFGEAVYPAQSKGAPAREEMTVLEADPERPSVGMIVSENLGVGVES